MTLALFAEDNTNRSHPYPPSASVLPNNGSIPHHRRKSKRAGMPDSRYAPNKYIMLRENAPAEIFFPVLVHLLRDVSRCWTWEYLIYRDVVYIAAQLGYNAEWGARRSIEMSLFSLQFYVEEVYLTGYKFTLFFFNICIGTMHCAACQARVMRALSGA